ncbi:Cytochrome c-554(548) [Grimontia celer]|uniref:Cytochrome c-554(548) n=1 Tax=Grimontia celer TaxID=1796497 RepID=A0A128F506_9GAMM|nr:cytochrome c [Grimontia celer]CZF81366.1 Cytochrome c-554(548) [Grimontia celer]
MLRILGMLGAVLLSTHVMAIEGEGDPVLGKQKAYTCQFCHGETGHTPKKDYPHINGQNALYLYNVMKSYQAGERTGAMGNMMRQQMSVLSDQDIKDIAAFYANQKRGKPE